MYSTGLYNIFWHDNQIADLIKIVWLNRFYTDIGIQHHTLFFGIKIVYKREIHLTIFFFTNLKDKNIYIKSLDAVKWFIRLELIEQFTITSLNMMKNKSRCIQTF